MFLSKCFHSPTKRSCRYWIIARKSSGAKRNAVRPNFSPVCFFKPVAKKGVSCPQHQPGYQFNIRFGLNYLTAKVGADFQYVILIEVKTDRQAEPVQNSDADANFSAKMIKIAHGVNSYRGGRDRLFSAVFDGGLCKAEQVEKQAEK